MDGRIGRITAFLGRVEEIRAGSESGIYARALEMQHFELPFIGLVERPGWSEEIGLYEVNRDV